MSLTTPSRDSMMFSAEMSLWATRFRWRCATAVWTDAQEERKRKTKGEIRLTDTQRSLALKQTKGHKGKSARSPLKAASNGGHHHTTTHLP